MHALPGQGLPGGDPFEDPAGTLRLHLPRGGPAGFRLPELGGDEQFDEIGDVDDIGELVAEGVVGVVASEDGDTPDQLRGQGETVSRTLEFRGREIALCRVLGHGASSVVVGIGGIGGIVGVSRGSAVGAVSVAGVTGRPSSVVQMTL